MIYSEKRRSALFDYSSKVVQNNITGDFVECGVFNGGSAGILADVLNKNKNRKLWLFDSFQGLPEPLPCDVDKNGEMGEKGICVGSELKVNELIFKKLGLKNEQVNIVKGWYNETIPREAANIEKIAVLHLDCDWYESVKICLENFYDKVEEGGYLIIDDYGWWKGCKKAIDEFFEKRNISPNKIEIDFTGIVIKKN